MFDCENREESFCRVSQYPWRPGGLKSCPVPPLSLVDWTDVAQTAWYEFMEERPDYKPPYEPLPYTISFMVVVSSSRGLDHRHWRIIVMTDQTMTLLMNLLWEGD